MEINLPGVLAHFSHLTSVKAFGGADSGPDGAESWLAFDYSRSPLGWVFLSELDGSEGFKAAFADGPTLEFLLRIAEAHATWASSVKPTSEGELLDRISDAQEALRPVASTLWGGLEDSSRSSTPMQVTKRRFQAFYLLTVENWLVAQFCQHLGVESRIFFELHSPFADMVQELSNLVHAADESEVLGDLDEQLSLLRDEVTTYGILSGVPHVPGYLTTAWCPQEFAELAATERALVREAFSRAQGEADEAATAALVEWYNAHLTNRIRPPVASETTPFPEAVALANVRVLVEYLGVRGLGVVGQNLVNRFGGSHVEAALFLAKAYGGAGEREIVAAGAGARAGWTAAGVRPGARPRATVSEELVATLNEKFAAALDEQFLFVTEKTLTDPPTPREAELVLDLFRTAQELPRGPPAVVQALTGSGSTSTGSGGDAGEGAPAGLKAGVGMDSPFIRDVEVGGGDSVELEFVDPWGPVNPQAPSAYAYRVPLDLNLNGEFLVATMGQFGLGSADVPRPGDDLDVELARLALSPRQEAVARQFLAGKPPTFRQRFVVVTCYLFAAMEYVGTTTDAGTADPGAGAGGGKK